MAESSTTRVLTGRSVIYTDVAEIDMSNIADVMDAAMEVHEQNSSDIDYLYSYYRGDQPVLNRTKDFNDNINNKVVVNHANQFVSFTTGYFLSAPIQYVNTGDDGSLEDLNRLNLWSMMESMNQVNTDIVTWQGICGVGFKGTLPREERLDDSISPFEVFSFDPRNTFVIYSSRLGHRPMMAVTYITLEDDSKLFYCYTDTDFYVLNEDYEDASDDFSKSAPHGLQTIPIFEFPLNNERMGYIELVISLLDTINTVQSNRADGVEAFVQAILCLENMMPEPQANQTQAQAEAAFMSSLKEIGGMFIPEGGKAYYLSQELNQDQTQTLVDDLYDRALMIAGIPDRSDGSTNGDTGSAIELRNGFADAETRANIAEEYFRKSERSFLNLVLYICNTMGGTNLLFNQVDIRFPRRNYTNDSTKVTNLVTMLACDYIHPKDAYEHSDMFPDPDAAFKRGMSWHEEQERSDVEELAALNVTEEDDEDNAGN